MLLYHYKGDMVCGLLPLVALCEYAASEVPPVGMDQKGL